MTPAVSVVIPTRFGRAGLWSSVETLLADPAVAEVVLADDRQGSAAAPPQLARLRGVVHLPTGGVGPAPARQLGTERAGGEIVLLLDDDVIPGAALASGHARRARPGLVVVGYMPVAEVARATTATARLYGRDYETRVRRYEQDPPCLLRHLWTGNVSMHRADALTVGLAQPEYEGRRHEDRDFGLRCLRAGLTGEFHRDLAAVHDYRRSVDAFLDDAHAQGAERVRLHQLHPEVLGSLALGDFSADLPAPLRAFARTTRREPMRRAARAGLTALVTLGGAGVRTAPLLALARRVEQQAGARAALACANADEGL